MEVFTTINIGEDIVLNRGKRIICQVDRQIPPEENEDNHNADTGIYLMRTNRVYKSNLMCIST